MEILMLMMEGRNYLYWEVNIKIDYFNKFQT